MSSPPIIAKIKGAGPFVDWVLENPKGLALCEIYMFNSPKTQVENINAVSHSFS